MAFGRKLSPQEMAGVVDLPDPGGSAPSVPIAPAPPPAPAPTGGIDPRFQNPDALAAMMHMSAPAAPPPAQSRQLTPEEMQGALDAPEPEDKGALHAFTANAANALYMGFGPTVQAGGEYLENKVKDAFGGGPTLTDVVTGKAQRRPSYDELRTKYAAELDAARAGHPIASTAGDVTGSIPTAILTPEVKAVQGASPAIRAGVNAGVQSGITGAGEAVSHGKSPAEVARAALVSGTVGAVTGGAMGHVAEKFVAGAPKASADWVVKDVIGAEAKGGSTPTTRKQLIRDKADVISVVEANPELAANISKAQSGKPEAISHALEHVDSEVKRVFEPRKNLYDELDKITATKPTTAGDLVASVEARVDDLASHLGTKKERNALRGVMEDVKETLGGGRKTTIDPEAEIMPGLKAAKIHDLKVAEMAKATTPEAKAAAQADIDSILKEHGRVASWDPKTPVKSIDLRDSVTRLQDDVANAMGGLNEKISEQRAREVLRPIHDVLEAHLSKAAAANPELVASIREMDRQGSALLRIRKVLDERLVRGEQKELAGTPLNTIKHMMHGAGATGAAVAVASGHYKTAAALAAAAALPAAKRGADRAMAALIRKASKGPLTAAELEAARAAGVPASIISKLSRGAGKVAAQAAVSAVKTYVPRLAARQFGKGANSMVNDFIADREE